MLNSIAITSKSARSRQNDVKNNKLKIEFTKSLCYAVFPILSFHQQQVLG